MTEIKPPYDELDTIINEYVDNYELTGDEGSYTPTLTEKLLIKDAIHGLLADTDWDNAWGRYIAALAKSQPVEQGEPVAWQYRMRPDWEDRWQGWVDCSKEAYRNMAKAPLIHDWHYEVRELFTHPVRPMSDEQIDAIPFTGFIPVSERGHSETEALRIFARLVEAHIKGATE